MLTMQYLLPAPQIAALLPATVGGNEVEQPALSYTNQRWLELDHTIRAILVNASTELLDTIIDCLLNDPSTVALHAATLQFLSQLPQVEPAREDKHHVLKTLTMPVQYRTLNEMNAELDEIIAGMVNDLTAIHNQKPTKGAYYVG